MTFLSGSELSRSRIFHQIIDRLVWELYKLKKKTRFC